MLSFRQFLVEAAADTATPFRAFPDIDVQSLDDFVTDASADGPRTGGLTEAPKKVIPRVPDPNDTHDYGDAEMLGAISSTPTDQEVQEYFGRIVTKTTTRKDDVVGTQVHRSLLQILRRDADNQTQIIIPKSGVAIDLQSGDYIDVEELKKKITQRPDVGGILTANGKMKKSGQPDEVFMNIGLPALRGLVVDEKTNEFKIINTCPGAGACQLFCYARKSSYIQYPESSQKLMRVLNFLMNDPKGFFAQITQEINMVVRKSKGKQLVVRWHDAGDFFSEEYKNAFFAMARRLPNVRFYTYTKIASVVNDANKPENFLINFSGGAKPGQEKVIDFSKTKHSMVVPKEMFADLAHKKNDEWQFKTAEGKDTLAQRLADKYGIDAKTVITFDQMKKMKVNPKTPNKWNVIVMAGEGDDSASRPDVLGTYLLIH